MRAAGIRQIGAAVEVLELPAPRALRPDELPLREQGAWAEQHIVAAAHAAVVPAGVPFDAAAALPVPALTAEQAIGDALQVQTGQTVLVNGAGGGAGCRGT
jgi:NADPH:quinone reductase-like Zn-dependent oxidoreductase